MNKTLPIVHTDSEFSIADLEAPAWESAEPAKVKTYWSGEIAPPDRHFTVRLLWTEDALSVRFEAIQSGPLVVSDKPDLTKKAVGLWDRDVCEIFIAPSLDRPNRYFEFEVAPTGEWLDVAIELFPDHRAANWDYFSGMSASARIEPGRTVSAIRVGWNAFGQTPGPGDRWLGNLFRCVGNGPDRGYLAWQPTCTPEPNFHVPERFGVFEFI
jgi:hypothetical protein